MARVSRAMLTNSQFDLGEALRCCRKGPPARPPSRTCQRVSKHRVALTTGIESAMQGTGGGEEGSVVDVCGELGRIDE